MNNFTVNKGVVRFLKKGQNFLLVNRLPSCGFEGGGAGRRRICVWSETGGQTGAADSTFIN